MVSEGVGGLRRQAEKELESRMGHLQGCWDDFLARLQSDDEGTGDYYAVAHLQRALDDVEYAASYLGESHRSGLSGHQEIRARFLATVDSQPALVRRLARWEMTYLVRRYAIYVSDLGALHNPELRQGEVTSILQVRDTIEVLIRLPEGVRPSEAEMRELSTLDDRLGAFVSTVPWWDWVLEEYREDIARWNASRFWWWGTPPD